MTLACDNDTDEGVGTYEALVGDIKPDLRAYMISSIERYSIKLSSKLYIKTQDKLNLNS